MKDFVAVVSTKLLIWRQPIKQIVLLFDRIAAPELSRGLPSLRYAENFVGGDYVNDLEWLQDSGILYEPEFEASEFSRDEQIRNEFLSVLERRKSFVEQIRESNPIRGTDEFRSFLLSYGFDDGIRVSRFTAAALRSRDECDAFPLISVPDSKSPIGEGRSEVIQVVFNNLPTPDDNTPWEQVIEYRKDQDSREKFFRLRHWMNQLAAQQLRANEIEDRLEWLLHDYERHMRVHKLKTHPGKLETFVTTGAELAEHIMKLNWGSAAKVMFSLKHRKLALLEAEMNTPGSEVAYVHKSIENFG